MKKIFSLLLVCSLFAISSQAQEVQEENEEIEWGYGNTKIGKIEADDSLATLEVDGSALATRWIDGLKEVLGEENVNANNFTNIRIEKKVGAHYLLLASNEEGTFNSAISLVLIEGFLYEELNLSSRADASMTLACSGCGYGCNPFVYKGKGYCTQECGTGNCTKTVTMTIKLFDNM